MVKKCTFVLILLLLTSSNQDGSIKDKLKMVHLYIPDRDLYSKDRKMKLEEKYIPIIYTKGNENTYRLGINKNEIHEEIFVLERFIATKFMDMNDAVRHHQMYNQEKFVIYHNQNGFFPISGNEYYLLNDSHSKIYEIIPDGQIHEFTEPPEIKQKKLLTVFCKYKDKIYTVPHELCE